MTEESDLWRNIQEIQSSNRFILQHLQQISTGLNTCPCPCHSTDREAELEYFREKLKHLEEKEKKKDEEIKVLKKNLKDLKEILDKVQSPQTVQSMFNDISHGTIMRQHVHFKEFAYHGNDNQNITNNKVDRSDEGNQPLKYVSKDSFTTMQLDGDVIETDGANSKVAYETNIESTRQTHSEKKEYSQGFKQSSVVRRGSNDLVKGQPKTSFLKNKNHTIGRSDIKTKEGERPDSSEISRVGDAQIKQNFGCTTPGKPSKDNFLKTPPAEAFRVKVIEQREKRTISPMEWHMAAHQEIREAQLSGLAELEGFYTVVCVDISFSMTQNSAWEQTKTFFTDLIDGFKETLYRYGFKEEYVALVTFGHRTEVLKRLTQDFTSLQTSFEGVCFGGPSPMFGGLLFSMAAMESTARLASVEVDGIRVYPRLVLITDGHLTHTNLLAGPDEPTLSDQDETNAQVLELMQKMEGDVDVLCVPVGDADKDFLQLMATVSNGRMLTHKDGRKVGTRLRKVLQAGKSKAGLPFTGSLYPTDSEEEDIAEILEVDEKRKHDRQSLQRLEIPTTILPEIGSRVRRGPDWMYRGHDSYGPGTVIGHSRNGEQIWVQWDNNDNTNIYRYGAEGCYDVLIADEPRVPKPNGELAVGCIVKPGKDWQQSPGNINLTSKGVVIQVDRNDILKVRWNNKERGEYVHKPGGLQQVEFSSPDGMGKPGANISTSSYVGIQGYSSQSRGDSEYLTQVPTSQRNKNKNKNLINKNATKQL